MARPDSENGWRPPRVGEDALEWVTVPGTNVRLQLLKGWPLAIMRGYAADHNAYVEPLRDADSAGWTPTNSVATSNHLNGTAMDLNWDSHRFHVSYDGFNSVQIATVRELLDFYEGTMFWGQDWGGNPFDCMHFQMGYDTWNTPTVGDFITRKIRADGYSTFRRGDQPATPPAAQVLSGATGLSVERATEILPTVASGLAASDCNNVNRIAMWLAQCGEESAGFSTTEEFASGAEYEGRCSDLGNCSPGDGVKYKGRTWIQITGKAHYREFSAWASSKGLCASSTQFVDNPASLGDLRWAGIGAAWYWTVSRPDINTLSDNGDVVTVTHRINGGEHGLADRQSRYARAHGLGDQLLVLATDAPDAPPTVGDDMAQVPQDQWDRVYREITQKLPSRSPLRHLNEGAVDTLAGFVLNVDGSQHVEIVKLLAGYGHPPTIALLQEVAGADPTRYPDRQGDARIAQAILADVTGAVAVINNAPAIAAPAQVVYLPAPVEPAAPDSSTSSTGQVIGAAYDALEALRLADALPIEGRAPLAALIGVLQTKNGSSL